MTSFRKFLLGALVFLGSFALALAAQCLGTTRAGNQCKNPGGASGYCHYHNPAAKHCAATNKNGTACRNSPQSGSAFCHVHRK